MTASPTPTGRVALVTGASSGIGRRTAHDLAARGDTVVMVSRGDGAGAEVADAIRAETGGDAHFLPADLSSLAAQRALADAFRARWARLDVLVLNAGAYFDRRCASADGIEMTWALNHLGTFGPAYLLADLLVASAPARVVVTSSGAALAGRLRWEDLEHERGYSGWRAYAQSKLANQVLARELARRLGERGVVAHSFHPGFVATGFGSGEGFTARVVGWLQRNFARTPEQGAETMTWLASADEPMTSNGGYWMDRTLRPHAAGARGADVGRRLWEVSLARARVTGAERARFEAAAGWAIEATAAA